MSKFIQREKSPESSKYYSCIAGESQVFKRCVNDKEPLSQIESIISSRISSISNAETIVPSHIQENTKGSNMKFWVYCILVTLLLFLGASGYKIFAENELKNEIHKEILTEVLRNSLIQQLQSQVKLDLKVHKTELKNFYKEEMIDKIWQNLIQSVINENCIKKEDHLLIWIC